MILGLDASTTTVGWAIAQTDSKIVDAGFFDIKKLDSNKDKSLKLAAFIEGHPNFKDIDKVNLEAALSGFCAGRTSQQVIIKLTRFNAVFEYILSERWSPRISVSLVNVNSARKKLFGKSRESGIKSKEFVKIRLEGIFDIHTFDKMTVRGNWDDRNSDMYDAMVLALT